MEKTLVAPNILLEVRQKPQLTTQNRTLAREYAIPSPGQVFGGRKGTIVLSIQSQ